MEKKVTFEQSLARLEEIVRELERGEAPLEQALALFEEGTGLVRRCSASLDEAAKKVLLLRKGADGQPEAEEFPPME